MGAQSPVFVAPPNPGAVAFVDGQNLFHCAKTAFGYTYPNYDPGKLATTICRKKGWKLNQVRFYSGVPPRDRDPRWHDFWARKTLRMTRAKIVVITRPLRYAEELLADGTVSAIPREKGIDVRIAIDVFQFADINAYDVALIFSQDQDLSELVPEIKRIAQRHKRWIKLASAFPVGPGTVNRRGIDKTDWIQIDQALYASCLDPVDW